MIEINPVQGVSVTQFRMARPLRWLPNYYTAAYWVDGLLIDTGCAHTARQLGATLKGWQVDTVVNTHSHEDHIGANATVQEMHSCPIQAHPDALPILKNPRLQPLQPYRRLYWGWPKPSQGQAIGDQVETPHFLFKVIETPGHSPDHICLFEPAQGWLFSGDAYVGGKDRALRQGYDIQGIIASLKKLAELPVQRIFSGSGSIRTEGARHLQAKIDYLENLGERIQELHRQGLSERRIRRTLFGREVSLTYLTLGHFSGLRLIRSYLAGPIPPGPEAGPETEQPPREPGSATRPDVAASEHSDFTSTTTTEGSVLPHE
jgi:glyoxylase-like metal-dependent hydrolase (beta-lactamase superfamily II)